MQSSWPSIWSRYWIQLNIDRHLCSRYISASFQIPEKDTMYFNDYTDTLSIFLQENDKHDCSNYPSGYTTDPCSILLENSVRHFRSPTTVISRFYLLQHGPRINSLIIVMFNTSGQPLEPGIYLGVVCRKGCQLVKQKPHGVVGYIQKLCSALINWPAREFYFSIWPNLLKWQHHFLKAIHSSLQT